MMAFLYICCYSTTEVEIPNDASFLVVNTVNFQPDSTWLIELNKSSPYLNNNDYTLNESAIVTIKDSEGNQIQLAPGSVGDRFFYLSNQKPEVGKEYELKIDVSGFPSVKSKSQIPSPIEIQKVLIDSTVLKKAYDFYEKNGNYGPYQGEIINCLISFYDPADEKNYYELELYRETESQRTDDDGNLIKEHFIFEQHFLFEGDINAFGYTIKTDELFNGALYTWSIKVPISAFYDFKFGLGADYSFKLKLHFTLKHLSKDYYNYHETLRLQTIRNGDPFAQPVIVHNNIENGAGIFAGFSQSVMILKNH
jgi:hypothetical protein